MLYYILGGKDDHEPIETDVMSWAQWFSTENRVVAQETHGRFYISTVFLGFNHAYFGGPPQVFETMIFEGSEPISCERCATWDEAVAQHARAVETATIKI